MADLDVPPIGVALIGAGIFAKEQHLPAILATPLLSLKAIYSRTLASCAAATASLEQKVDWYSEETTSASPPRGYADLLENPNIKAIIIALPITTQPAFIRAALAAGKHVLSEKPIAPTVELAEDLLTFYRDNAVSAHHSSSTGGNAPTWCIAENFRFHESKVFAAQKVAELGRVLGFRFRHGAMIMADGGSKYFKTSWRKRPEYQGGFLLDAGVHHTAGLRLLLGGGDNEVERVSAFTTQLQPHLPPVDTVNATIQLRSGAAGTYQASFGTTFKGVGYSVACERGTVTCLRGEVVVEKGGVEEKFPFPNESFGVVDEVGAWAKSLHNGSPDERLSVEEALADLKLLEALLSSGDSGGKPLFLAPN